MFGSKNSSETKRSGREIARLSEHAIRETLDTGLFRSLGTNRFGFSHQTYAEYLAAQYLVDHRLPAPEILKLILNADSGKVVPQLRETASWLAALVPVVRSAIISGDPLTLFSSDTPPSSDADRGELIRQTLHRYDREEVSDLRIIEAAGRPQDGARPKYAGIANDLKQYIADQSRNEKVRRAAILMAQFVRLAELQKDVLIVAFERS